MMLRYDLKIPNEHLCKDAFTWVEIWEQYCAYMELSLCAGYPVRVDSQVSALHLLVTSDDSKAWLVNAFALDTFNLAR
jgi:hypothetical protein